MDATIIKATPNSSYPGAVIVTVHCPQCGKKHTHGVPEQDGGEAGHWGHRVAHCVIRADNDFRGYYLSDPDGLVEKARAK